MIKKIKRTREGSAQHAPRLVGEILHDYLENSNEPLAVAYREHTTESEKQGWNPNTHLGVDLKTLLRSDECMMKAGKSVSGRAATRCQCRDRGVSLSRSALHVHRDRAPDRWQAQSACL